MVQRDRPTQRETIAKDLRVNKLTDSVNNLTPTKAEVLQAKECGDQ